MQEENSIRPVSDLGYRMTEEQGCIAYSPVIRQDRAPYLGTLPREKRKTPGNFPGSRTDDPCYLFELLS